MSRIDHQKRNRLTATQKTLMARRATPSVALSARETEIVQEMAQAIRDGEYYDAPQIPRVKYLWRLAFQQAEARGWKNAPARKRARPDGTRDRETAKTWSDPC